MLAQKAPSTLWNAPAGPNPVRQPRPPQIGVLKGIRTVENQTSAKMSKLVSCLIACRNMLARC